jgi:hypothetical protein
MFGKPCQMPVLAMTSLRIALLIFLSTVSSQTAISHVRDPAVEHWISYEILGPRDHPYPITYLSTRRFKVNSLEFLLVLARRDYARIAQFTTAQFAQPECPGTMPAEDVWRSVEVTVHNKSGTQKCILPQKLACKYLSGVAKRDGLNFTSDEASAIRIFMGAEQCRWLRQNK